MKNLFDFGRAYGFGFESVDEPEVNVDVDESVETGETSDDMNTQELQEAIPQVIDTDDVTNVVDDLGETFEEGNDERPIGDIDYVPEDLKAEIDAIEEQADAHAQVGADIMMPEEPVHEVPGGMDLTADEPVNGMDEVEEYASSINEINITGNQGDMDEYMRKEYNEDSFDESSITDGKNNAETTVSSSDAAPIDAEISGTGNAMDDAQDRGVEEVEVSADDVDGEDTTEDAISAGDVLGTESDDGMDDEVEEEPVEEEEVEEEVSEEEPVEEEATEDVEEETESEEVAVTVTEDGEETMCAEEHELVASLDVELNMDSTILDDESAEEAEQAASETELEMHDDALGDVEEMQVINAPDGETPTPVEDGTNEQENATLDEGTMMSDVVGEMVADDSHGEDGFFEGDIPVHADVEADDQLSEGDASYDEEGSSEDAGEEVENVEEAEDVAEEDAVEDTVDGDGEEVDTPEEADDAIEEETEEVAEDESEDEDVEVEDEVEDEE